MNVRRYFREVLGVVDSGARSTMANERMPATLLDLYELDSQLEESVLETDVRILTADKVYEVNQYTVFAEERQNVVLWAYVDSDDDSQCFQLGHETPVAAIRETRNVKDIVLALVVINSLSSRLFPYYDYIDLEIECLEQVLAKYPRATEVSKLPVIVSGGVACTLQATDAIFVSAASRNEKELQEFIASLKDIEYRTES